MARKWPVVSKKFFRVHMDLLGPFPVSKTGHKYNCVFVDSLNRFTYLYALLDKTATSVAHALHECILQFGSPKIIISDSVDVRKA